MSLAVSALVDSDASLGASEILQMHSLHVTRSKYSAATMFALREWASPTDTRREVDSQRPPINA